MKRSKGRFTVTCDLRRFNTRDILNSRTQNKSEKLKFSCLVIIKSLSYFGSGGDRGSTVVASSIPAGLSWFFIDIKSIRSHYDPGVDPASNRNEFQQHFLGGKGDQYVRLTTLPSPCAVVMEFGNLNFLEISGPLQSGNGTVLSLPLFRYLHFI